MSHSFQRLADISQHVLLRSIVTTRSGGTPSRSNSEYWGDYLPWITAKDLKSFHLKDSLEKLSLKAFEKGVPLAKPNDIIVLVRGMGLLKDVPIGLVKCEMSFGQDTKVLSPREDVDGEYLAYCLVAARPRLMGMVSLAGHGTGRLETEKLLSLRIWLPERKIQKKITNLFSKWDKAIALTEKLIAAKRRLKQGLMQQLLTGKRRFPEFKHKLVDTKIKKINVYLSRGIAPKYAEVEKDGSLRILNQKAIRWGYINLSEIKYFDNSARGSIKSNSFVETGDIVLNSTGHGTIGRAYVLKSEDGRFIADSHVTIIRVDRTQILPEYLCYHMESVLGQRQIYKLITGSTGQAELSPQSLGRYCISLPSLEEQEKICSLLSWIDYELSRFESLKGLYKQQKNGLMQKLLTGNIRIPVSEDAP